MTPTLRHPRLVWLASYLVPITIHLPDQTITGTIHGHPVGTMVCRLAVRIRNGKFSIRTKTVKPTRHPKGESRSQTP